MKKSDERDERLAKTIAGTLDESLQALDEVSLQRLKQARVKSLATPKPSAAYRHRKMLIAAGFALLALIPVISQHSAFQSVDQDMEMALQEAPLSAEEMDDMDMLMALEDTDV